jgi:L-rhamnose isomerase/sugar isomerase
MIKIDFNQSTKEEISKHSSAITNIVEVVGDESKVSRAVDKLKQLQIAIPSWALGTGGTRFGRFPGGGEPSSLAQKIEDVALLNKLNKSSSSISLHIPWDRADNIEELKSLAESLELSFDAVNSNTFQDQPDQLHSYKYGSLCHTDKEVRQLAINHNKEVISIGENLGSKALTVWLADGSIFPGQHDFKSALGRTLDSLSEIYSSLPPDWTLLLEYKPYEPNFYSMVIPDWGTSYLLVNELGDQAKTLVDLGHHLPNTNIEQIVSTLVFKNKLGGFHFNDSKYGDDDITVGSLKPYQLFLIFCELVKGMDDDPNLDLSWMIDASHNIKDPLEDLLQSVEAIKIAYAQALLVDYNELAFYQNRNDISKCQEILQDAFRTDVRALVREARLQLGGVYDPLKAFRQNKIREKLTSERGANSKATGL